MTKMRVRLNMSFRPVGARAVLSGAEFNLREAAGGGVEASVPTVRIHEIVCFRA